MITNYKEVEGLHPISADTLTKEEAQILPKELRAIGKRYWLKPEDCSNFTYFVDEIGKISKTSIFHRYKFRIVLTFLENAFESKLYTKYNFDNVEWYVIDKNKLLSADYLPSLDNSFDTSLPGTAYFNRKDNHFIEKETSYYYNKHYRIFSKKDIDICINNGILTIPSYIVEIENNACEGRSDIRELIIPDSVTRLGNSAFKDCFALEIVTLGSGLISGGNCVFENCRNIKQVNVKDLKHISNYNCDNFGNPLLYGAELYVDGQKYEGEPFWK